MTVDASLRDFNFPLRDFDSHSHCQKKSNTLFYNTMTNLYVFGKNRQNRKVRRFVFSLAIISMLYIGMELGTGDQYSRQTTSSEKLYEPLSITDFKPPEGSGADGDFLKRPEIIIPASERKPLSEIRYAAFGSSSTWGASLENREEECYIWRLSDLDQERGKNLAIRSNGPDYPSSW